MLCKKLLELSTVGGMGIHDKWEKDTIDKGYRLGDAWSCEKAWGVQRIISCVGLEYRVHMNGGWGKTGKEGCDHT